MVLYIIMTSHVTAMGKTEPTEMKTSGFYDLQTNTTYSISCKRSKVISEDSVDRKISNFSDKNLFRVYTWEQWSIWSLKHHSGPKPFPSSSSWTSEMVCCLSNQQFLINKQLYSTIKLLLTTFTPHLLHSQHRIYLKNKTKQNKTMPICILLEFIFLN